MAIHAFRIDGEIEIWSDCEIDTETDGRCLASGASLETVIADARTELQADARALDQLVAEDVREPSVHGQRLDAAYRRERFARRVAIECGADAQDVEDVLRRLT